jgi:hypothetical protein
MINKVCCILEINTDNNTMQEVRKSEFYVEIMHLYMSFPDSGSVNKVIIP